ncbi:MAG: hypothetical protein PUB93_08485 [Firmicutes bacterium]|nr:hypothetical protein [Bacillota bacterium]
MANRSRYREMAQLMTALLIAAAVIFVLYLIAAGAGILWLKILNAVIALAVSALSLGFLCLVKEAFRQRSLWLTAGFFSVLLCTVVSLIVAFP